MVSVSEAIVSSMPFLGLGFMIGLSFAVLYYFYSRIVNDATLETKAKEHIKRVGEGFIIIALLLLGSSFVNVLMGTASGLNTNDDVHIILAELSLYEIINRISWLYVLMWVYDIILVFVYGVVLHFSLDIVFTISFKIFPYVALDDVVEAHNQLSGMLVSLSGMAFGRLALLDLSYFMLYITLPLGLFLYFMPISKKTGASLIALFLAVYYAFPFSVLLTDYLLLSPTQAFKGVSFTAFKNAVPQHTLFKDIVLQTSSPYFYDEFAGFEKLDGLFLLPQDSMLIEMAMTESIVESERQGLVNREVQRFDNPTLYEVGFDDLGFSPMNMFKKVFKKFIGPLALSYVGVFGDFGKALLKSRVPGVSRLSRFLYKALGGVLSRLGLAALVDPIMFFLMILPVVAKIGAIAWFLMEVPPFEMVAFFFELLVREIFVIGQFAAILFVSFILEIIITVTAYREFATMLKGDATLLGLTKVI